MTEPKVRILMAIYGNRPEDFAAAQAIVSDRLPALLGKLNQAVTAIRFQQALGRALKEKGLAEDLPTDLPPDPTQKG